MEKKTSNEPPLSMAGVEGFPPGAAVAASPSRYAEIAARFRRILDQLPFPAVNLVRVDPMTRSQGRVIFWKAKPVKTSNGVVIQ